MASSRISTPMRGVSSQLNRLAIRRGPVPVRSRPTIAYAPSARTITTSPSSRASTPSVTASASPASTIIPLEQRTVNATIHHFPSLEPLRFEPYAANHLYLPTRRDILHRAVVFEGDAARFGNANTKWRDEVHGSSRKVRPQKGSGAARLGDKRSPMLRGGGVAFGPKPRDFATDLPRKVYDLAYRTALSYRFRKGELIIVDNAMELEVPSTTHLRHIFQRHGWGRNQGRSVLVTLEHRPLLARALEEESHAGWVAPWNEIDVKDILSLGRVVIERNALQNILLSHQSDLVRSAFPPKLIKYSPPSELESILGWSEFRDLELVTPEEKERLRPEFYERVAEKRIEEAAKAGEVEGAPLLISAYQLKSEAARMYAETMGEDPAMDLIGNEDDALHIEGLQKRVEMQRMQAIMCEYKAEAFILQGKLARAEEEKAKALQYDDNAALEQAEIDEALGIEYEETEEVEQIEDAEEAEAVQKKEAREEKR